MYRIYGMALSGNCYKLKLLMHLLQLDYQWVEVDLLNGETQQSDFLNINPSGKIPVLELPEGGFLPESNAGLYYLASGTPLLPQDRLEQARVIQWLCFEQYTHEPAIAVGRFINKFLPPHHPRQKELALLHEKGYKALNIMEMHLTENQWFVDVSPTIADIALYAYTHVAEDGRFELSGYPQINSWIDRISHLDHYIPME